MSGRDCAIPVIVADLGATEDMRLLAECRAEEAAALLGLGHFSGAYYLAGYAVECAIKAVLSKDLASHRIPLKKAVEDVHTHKLDQLMKQAGLDAAISSNPTVGPSWLVVSDWSEQARYQLHDAVAANDMVRAVAAPMIGVLPWVILHW